MSAQKALSESSKFKEIIEKLKKENDSFNTQLKALKKKENDIQKNDQARSNELRYANDARKTDIHKQRDANLQKLHSFEEELKRAEQEKNAHMQADL